MDREAREQARAAPAPQAQPVGQWRQQSEDVPWGPIIGWGLVAVLFAGGLVLNATLTIVVAIVLLVCVIWPAWALNSLVRRFHGH